MNHPCKPHNLSKNYKNIGYYFYRCDFLRKWASCFSFPNHAHYFCCLCIHNPVILLFFVLIRVILFLLWWRTRFWSCQKLNLLWMMACEGDFACTPLLLPIYNEGIYEQWRLNSEIFWVLVGLWLAYNGPWETCVGVWFFTLRIVEYAIVMVLDGIFWVMYDHDK